MLRNKTRTPDLDPTGRVPQHQLGKIEIGGTKYQLLRLGAWNSAVGYLPGNLVASGGADYVCILAHVNHTPPNATYWEPFVESEYLLDARRVWAKQTSTSAAEEHLNVVTTTVPANSSTFLDLVSYSGAGLVDVTTLATRAVVSVNGVYAASGSAQVFLPAAEPAGDGIDFGVTAVQASLYPPSTPLPGVGTFVNPGNTSDHLFGTGAVTGIMRGGLDWFQVAVTNRNSYDVDVIAGLSIVLIVAL